MNHGGAIHGKKIIVGKKESNGKGISYAKLSS
jgi:hypothetical protein